MKQVDPYMIKKISSNMAKKFGTIKKGNEQEHLAPLLAMESNLMKVNRENKINNGRRVIEAIHICLLIVDGYLNQVEYALEKHITDYNKDYVYALLMSFDPFTNKKMSDLAGQSYDINDTDKLTELFADPIKCLLRIEESVKLFNDALGLSGYFDFLEHQIGHAIP